MPVASAAPLGAARTNAAGLAEPLGGGGPTQVASAEVSGGGALSVDMPAAGSATCRAERPPMHPSDAVAGSAGGAGAAAHPLPWRDAHGPPEPGEAALAACAAPNRQPPRAVSSKGPAAVCDAAVGELLASQLPRPLGVMDVHAPAVLLERQPLAEARLLPDGQGGSRTVQAGNGSPQAADSNIRSPSRAPRAPGKPRSPAKGGKPAGKRLLLPVGGVPGSKALKDGVPLPAAQVAEDGLTTSAFLATYVVDFCAVAKGTHKVSDINPHALMWFKLADVV